MRSARYYFFFGLSGIGKTTLIQHLLQKKKFATARFTVTRERRFDDDPALFEYVTFSMFQKYLGAGIFFIAHAEKNTGYGYRKTELLQKKITLLYGLPAQLENISRLGKCILITGDAGYGLELRKEESIKKKRIDANAEMQRRFYSKSHFLQKMDLVLKNNFCNLQAMACQFIAFDWLVSCEAKALDMNPKALRFVLKIHARPFPGLQSHLSFWLEKACHSQTLMRNFYSRLLEDEKALDF